VVDAAVARRDSLSSESGEWVTLHSPLSVA
jgi:hypothetical protein